MWPIDEVRVKKSEGQEHRGGAFAGETEGGKKHCWRFRWGEFWCNPPATPSSSAAYTTDSGSKSCSMFLLSKGKKKEKKRKTFALFTA